MRALAISLVVFVACGSEPPTGPHVESASPDYGPLVGGSTIQLHGAGFAPTDRVLVGGREAPLVRALDSETLELVIPPGEQPGDAEVVVLAPDGTTSARGIFHYSTPPTITAVTPDDVVASSVDTVITVTGTGFADEAAGEPIVLVGGLLVSDVTIENDATVRFAVPAGRVFARPDIELLNQRGRAAHARAFRYTPSANPGLLLFPRYGNFAVFYDPVEHTTLPVPALAATTGRFTSVFRDRDGEYWGVDTGNRVGRLDLETQTLVAPISSGLRLPAVTRVGDQYLALTRYWGAGPRIGTLDPATAVFSPLGSTMLVCCGGWGIASDGTTVWFTSRLDWQTVTINTVDPSTGTIGTPVTIAGGSGFRVEELRYWNGALYGTTAFGKLVTIDPTTGVVTDVIVTGERYQAMEPFD